MSILSTSPTNTRMFDAKIAATLKDINAAVIIQQLNYWMNKDGVGIFIDGVKFVYNTFIDWVNEQFPWLSVWQFRKAMSLLRSLGIVRVIRHKAKQWNQTNFYTLDSDRLMQFLESTKAESAEISELCHNSSQSNINRSLEISDSNVSYIESKITPKEKTANSVVVETKNYLTREDLPQKTASSTEIEEPVSKSGQLKNGSKKVTKVDAEPKAQIVVATTGTRTRPLVNSKWRSQIKDLDDAGIRANPTLIKLLQTYDFEQVKSAIALVKTKKRKSHVPNPAGYFTKALKENWIGEGVASQDEDADTLFRYWYDLARELGCCSGQEMRDEEQWVCVSGSWERWKDSVKRGYSLEYLKKIKKRNSHK